MSLIFEQNQSKHFGATINLESPEPWWLDDLRLNHAKKMTLEAELGLRRPIHIVVATNRSAPFEDIAKSLIQSSAPTGILSGKTPSGRPIVRWTYIAMDSTPTGALSTNMAKAIHQLSSAGVESTLLNVRNSSEFGDISNARVAVLEYIRAMPHDDNPIIAWLDDDLSFDALIPNDGAPMKNLTWSWLHEVWNFHEENPDVAIGLGDVMGSPPLPASSTITSNLLDLQAFQTKQKVVNDSNRWAQFDYYYDISETREDFSPWPMIYEIERSSRSKFLHDILVNGVIARPLVITQELLLNPRKNRYVRGGNTIVYNLKWLDAIDHPNIPRRGDTIWVLKAGKDGAKIRHFPVPLYHHREQIDADWDVVSESCIATWCKRIEDDLIGSSIQRWIRNGMNSDDEAFAILSSRAKLLQLSLKQGLEIAYTLDCSCKKEIIQALESGIIVTEDLFNFPGKIDCLLNDMREYMEA